MDKHSLSRAASGQLASLAWSAGSASIFADRHASALTRRMAHDSDPSRSNLMSPDRSTNNGQPCDDFRPRHRLTEDPLDAFGTLSLLESSSSN